MKAVERWEHFPHGADVGVRGYGASLEHAFEQAALAMMAAIVAPGTVAARELVEVDCAAPDDELLLVDWLNALIFEMAIRKMLFSRFEVAIGAGGLHGKAWGERVDPERHELIVEPKGATVTGLRVAHGDDDNWVAQCVVDV